MGRRKDKRGKVTACKNSVNVPGQMEANGSCQSEPTQSCQTDSPGKRPSEQSGKATSSHGRLHSCSEVSEESLAEQQHPMFPDTEDEFDTPWPIDRVPLSYPAEFNTSHPGHSSTAIPEPTGSQAQEHFLGGCRPCTNILRNGRCKHGASCKFCHLHDRDPAHARQPQSVRLREKHTEVCQVRLESALPNSRAPVKDIISVWRVSPSLAYQANVRMAKCSDSRIIGCKKPGDFVKGHREGEWFKLFGDDGFIAIASRLDGCVVLEPLVGMRLPFPVCHAGGTASARQEQAIIESAIELGTKLRFRLPGLPPFDLPIGVVAGLLQQARFMVQCAPSSNDRYSSSAFRSDTVMECSIHPAGLPGMASQTRAAGLSPEFLVGSVALIVIGTCAAYAAAAGVVGLACANPRATLAIAAGIGANHYLTSAISNENEATRQNTNTPAPRATPQRPLQQSFLAGQCQICLEALSLGRQQTVMLSPCNHICLHVACFRELCMMEGGDRCPVCRARIDATVLL